MPIVPRAYFSAHLFSTPMSMPVLSVNQFGAKASNPTNHLVKGLMKFLSTSEVYEVSIKRHTKWHGLSPLCLSIGNIFEYSGIVWTVFPGKK